MPVNVLKIATFEAVCKWVHGEKVLQSKYLNSGGDKEVLLLQAQLLALVRAVIWIQHAAQGLCTLLGQNGLYSATHVGELATKAL